MAPSPFSLLLLRRRYNHHLFRHFSLSSSPTPSPNPPKPDSLSARLSFVFDKIDDIQKDRSEKDGALQRIRAWRESRRQPPPNDLNNATNDAGLGFATDTVEPGNVAAPVEKEVVAERREIEVAHPWPEWLELMERLVKQNYFDHKRYDEDQIIQKLVGNVDDELEKGDDLMRDWKTVNAAFVNFGKDRFDIFRSLSRQDIQILVGYGCPSTDKKVVFSSKLLRKHVHLDEGDVCSSCSLRTTCERAYLVTNKEDEARTIDVMRVLLAYGFDPINGSVENKSLLKQKSVKAAVRKLLHGVVRLSAVPIDPCLPPPVIKKRPPKVKQPPPPPKRRVGRDDIEMKKGDWSCPKCNFMNFAKNVVCLQCDAKRPKRQLLPGEWECPQCNFLNYRRNMSCFNCEHKRPPDEYIENQAQERQNRPPTRFERVPDRSQVSNAWNFDFDDDESDGADVAAFEYADPRAMNEDRYLDSPPDGSFGGPREVHSLGRNSTHVDNENSMPGQLKHNMSFDDFEDEDDDIDSYELDSQNRNQRQEVSSVPFSDVEDKDYSVSESDEGLAGFRGRSPSAYPKSSKRLHQKGALSDIKGDDPDFGSDEDLPVHPKWKSSHVTDSGVRNGALRGPKQTSFQSDDDDMLVFGSDDDHEEGSARRQGRVEFKDSGRRGFRQADDLDDEFTTRHGKQQYRNSGQNGFSQRHESNRGGRRDFNFVNKKDFDGDLDRPSHGSRRNERGSFGNRGDDFGRPSRGYRGNQRSSFDNHGNDLSRSSRGSRGNQRATFDKDDDDFRETSFGSRGGRRGSFDNQGDDFGRSSRGSRGNQKATFDKDDDDFRGTSFGSRGGRRGSFDNQGDDYGRSSRGSRGNQRGSFDNYGQQGKSRRPGGRLNVNGSAQRETGNRGQRRSNGPDDWSNEYSDRPVRQRRNVR